MTLEEKAYELYKQWENDEFDTRDISDLLVDFTKEQLSDKEKEIENLKREKTNLERKLQGKRRNFKDMTILEKSHRTKISLIEKQNFKLLKENEQLKTLNSNLVDELQLNNSQKDKQIAELKERIANGESYIKAMESANSRVDIYSVMAENEQLKADLEKHKQSELATGKLLLAEKQKNEQLKAQIEKMKCCGNCKHLDSDNDCYYHAHTRRDCSNMCGWELDD